MRTSCASDGYSGKRRQKNSSTILSRNSADRGTQRREGTEGRRTPGLDGRTTRAEGYRISQRKRKRVEEIFGCLKTVGGLRRSRFIGQAKTQMAAFLSGAANNLLRITKLTEAVATS